MVHPLCTTCVGLSITVVTTEPQGWHRFCCCFVVAALFFQLTWTTLLHNDASEQRPACNCFVCGWKWTQFTFCTKIAYCHRL